MLLPLLLLLLLLLPSGVSPVHGVLADVEGCCCGGVVGVGVVVVIGTGVVVGVVDVVAAVGAIVLGRNSLSLPLPCVSP